MYAFLVTQLFIFICRVRYNYNNCRYGTKTCALKSENNFGSMLGTYSDAKSAFMVCAPQRLYSNMIDKIISGRHDKHAERVRQLITEEFGNLLCMARRSTINTVWAL